MIHANIRYQLLLIAVLIIPAIGICQNFDIDSCAYYFESLQDDKLLAYLLIQNEDAISLEDKIGLHLYKTKYYRVTNNKDAQLRHLTLGYDLVKGRKDLLECHYLDEWALTYNKDLTTLQALEYIDSSILIKKGLNAQNTLLAHSYEIKGNLFFNAFNEVAKDHKLDSAIHYYNKAINHDTSTARKIHCLENITSCMMLSGKGKNLEYIYSTIIDHYIEKNILRNEISAKLNLASFYANERDSLCFYQIIDEITPIIIENEWLELQKDLLKIKIYNAFQLNHGYIPITNLQDSLLLLEKQISSTLLDQITKFELDNKVAAAQADLYKNRFWKSILLGTTITMALLLIGLYKYLMLKRKTIEDELQHTKTLSDLNATKAKMEGEQKERESIASVLHDQVASLLTAADMHLKVAKKKAPNTHGLTQVSSIIKDINQQVRDLSHQLVSPTLMKFGLEAGIETLTHRMAPEQLNLHFSSNLGERRYDTQVETFIFQSCSELIQNVLKHSTATSCEITLTEKEGSLHLFVIDNGYNEHIDHSHATGLGLTHIYKRAAAMGGGFDFHLRDNGAYSTLTIPAKPIQVEVINHSY